MFASSPLLLERADDPRYGFVDGEEGLEALLVVLADLGDPRLGQQRAVADADGLVGDVGLVEAGRAGEPRGGEVVAVPGRRHRGGLTGRVVGLARTAAVRGEERDREVERLGPRRAPVDDVDRLPGVEIGLVRALVRVERPVLVERVAVEAVRGRVDGAAPLVVPRWDLRRIPAPVAVQVLAEVGGVVAGLLEPDGQRVRVVELRVAAARRGVAHDAVVVRVLAGEERRARGAAERVRDEALGEGRPAVAQESPHVRHDPHRLDRLVVGHDHDDVRARLRRRRLRGVGSGRHGRSRKEDSGGCDES